MGCATGLESATPQRRSNAETANAIAARFRFTSPELVLVIDSGSKGKAGCFPNHLSHLCEFVMRRWAIIAISLLLAIDARAQQQPPKSPPEPPGDSTTPTPSAPAAPPPAVIVAPPA